MKIDIIAGARPNFVKIAPIIREIKKTQLLGNDLTYRLVHTGQHFDDNMSHSFFEQLEIPLPNINLGAHGGTQTELTSKIMIGYEELLKEEKSGLCLVVGDVTSTMACAIVSQKAGIPVAHVEAGIRSNDWSMPEEINRIVTDSLTNYFFTTSEYANQNLLSNGVAKGRIYFVGNTMIDTLLRYQAKLIKPKIFNELNLLQKNYLVLTMHRPSNVDNCNNLSSFLYEISKHSGGLPVVFPVHPRTGKVLSTGLKNFKNIFFIPPLSYLEFIYLIKCSKAVVTDSGGITEETTVMGIPCMTLRDSTERPETCFLGTNELLGTDPGKIGPAFEILLNNNWKKGQIPPLWDGHTSERIVNILLKEFNINHKHCIS